MTPDEIVKDLLTLVGLLYVINFILTKGCLLITAWEQYKGGRDE